MDVSLKLDGGPGGFERTATTGHCCLSSACRGKPSRSHALQAYPANRAPTLSPEHLMARVDKDTIVPQIRAFSFALTMKQFWMKFPK
ncbi:hypothetical protein CC78DRAFT_579617 [Lojkania enalia]|uniref:Uncharacterized protein n=1 Tax=Lojkania enalia TaxID=147567 RepID=A0A9P4KEY4_9PLEO|nr:hypothetical protein CC78DRAFT_579617 [Didymosphaeria enalia]